MKTMERPSARSRRSTSNSCFTSGGDSADVGSSRMMICAPENSTRESSTSCCRPTGSEPMVVVGSMSRPRLAISCFASRFMRPQSTVPMAVSGWLPRNTFSATVRSGTTESSWCTMPMELASASPAERSRTSRPLIFMVPSKSVWTPAMIFMVVDLPAPFSPTRPWISPGSSVKSTFCSAITPPKCFDTLESSSRGCWPPLVCCD